MFISSGYVPQTSLSPSVLRQKAPFGNNLPDLVKQLTDKICPEGISPNKKPIVNSLLTQIILTISTVPSEKNIPNLIEGVINTLSPEDASPLEKHEYTLLLTQATKVAKSLIGQGPASEKP
jgi:hypothetical protein